MARLQLMEFQQEAANKLFENAVDYFVQGQDKIGGRLVPYVGQLKAVTGAGKTPILTSVIGKLNPSIVLWTTKFGSVVDQTVANLRPGGKYHHLFGSAPVEVIKFSEIPSFAAWQRILEAADGTTIIVSTVATWNAPDKKSDQKDERLNVHRIHPDWGGHLSRWDQLKQDRKRKLWIVYDEAHNTTSEQIDQLDDLEPAGFFVASASPVKGKLLLYLTNLPEDVRKQRIVPVRTVDVVDAELLKSTISFADYNSSADVIIIDAAKKRQELQNNLAAKGETIVPKAIYVVEASNVTAKGIDSRPIAIWKTLTSKCGISTDSVAVCTNTKDLPKDAIRVDSIDQLSDQFTHIIFNKKLQEGWDDPSVYVCYFDGKTDSATRIQQVIGRALRQPNARHLSDEDLNTGYFYVNCPNETLEKIIDQLKEELRIYKDDADAPDDFEPFKIKEGRKILPKIALKPEWEGKLKVPMLQLELPLRDRLGKLVDSKTFDFSAQDRKAQGKALVNVVSVRTGDVTENARDLLEDMRVRCGAYLQEHIRALSKNCLNSMPPSVFSNPKLDKTACYKSKALEYYRQLAVDVVREYENHVKLGELDDPDESDYVVGPYQPSGTVEKRFSHAGHPRYDASGFNPDELDMAKALDKFNHVWVRNKPKLDYGIPLPVKSGSSFTFYPDFLWWVKDSVWAIDPTGKFILEEKVRSKLLSVPPPLKIALVSHQKLDASYKELPDDGWTLLRFRLGNAAPEVFDTLDELLKVLIMES